MSITWDELYDRAIDTAHLDRRLKAKDNARAEVRALVLEKEGYDIETAECPEDEVDYYTKLHEIRFYENGIISHYVWE